MQQLLLLFNDDDTHKVHRSYDTSIRMVWNMYDKQQQPNHEQKKK